MPVALIAPEAMRHKPAPYVDMLKEAGFEILYPDDPAFTRGRGEAETIEQLAGCDAIIAGGEFFTKHVIESLPRLRVIARSGVGYDRVDLAAATAHKVAVTITPTANHEAVAEHALMLMLGVAKSIVANDRASRAGQWPMRASQPLRDRTCGIFGLGRIGRSLAVRVRALGMRVMATEKFPQQPFVEEHGIELVDFSTLLAHADFLSVHCPANEETTGLFDRRAFAAMKPGSVFINTARGQLMVERDLAEAVRSGHLLGAGLDVYEVEPPSPDNPLFELENVVCTPHVASNDTRAREDMGIEAADCIVKLYRGEWPDGAVVNDELRAGWTW